MPEVRELRRDERLLLIASLTGQIRTESGPTQATFADTETMVQVSIQALKQNLSSYLARAEAGEPIVVTRHGKPLVRIVAAEDPEVRVGKHFGKTKLTNVVRESVGALALRILDADRGDRGDGALPGDEA